MAKKTTEKSQLLKRQELHNTFHTLYSQLSLTYLLLLRASLQPAASLPRSPEHGKD